MKKFLLFLFIVLVFTAVIAIITKPSDQACLDNLKDKATSQIENSNQNALIKLGEEALINHFSTYIKDIFRIEDKVLYKNIYLAGTNDKVAIACFGSVIINNNEAIQNEIEQERRKEEQDKVATTMSEIKNDVKNLFHKKKSIENQSNTQEANGNHNLAYWQSQLQQANSTLESDKIELQKAEKFHFGRLANTKKREIDEATTKVNNDEIWVQQCSDAISKFQ